MVATASREKRLLVPAIALCAALGLGAAAPAWASFKIVGQEAPTADAAAGAERPDVSAASTTPSTYIAPPDLTGLTPVGAERIADGAYPIEVTSSSSMFRIVEAELRVDGEEMTCALTLSGTGYEKLFVGTAEQAAVYDAASDAPDACWNDGPSDRMDADLFAYFEEDAQGRYVYTIPVEALDCETDCAAFSFRRQMWYDRTLVFLSSSLPEGVILEEGQVKASIDEPDLADAEAGDGTAGLASAFTFVCEPGAMCMRPPSGLVEDASGAA